MEPKQQYSAKQSSPTIQQSECTEPKIDKGAIYLNISENIDVTKKKCSSQMRRSHKNQKKEKNNDKFDLRGYHLMYANYYNCYEASIKLQRTYAEAWSRYYAHSSTNLDPKWVKANGENQNDMIVDLHRSYVEAWSKFYEQNSQNGDAKVPASSVKQNTQIVVEQPNVLEKMPFHPMLVLASEKSDEFLDKYDFFQNNELQPSAITLPNSKEPNLEILHYNTTQNTEYKMKVGGSKNWFGFLKHFKPKPIKQMVLPDDNNPTIIWNESKKCWLNIEDNDISQEIKQIKGDSTGANQFLSPTGNPFRRNKKFEYKNIFNE